jgi:hypothetical protein
VGPDSEAKHPGPELVEAYSGARADVELIRSVLEGSGIECALWGTGSTYLPETGAKLNAVRVMVRPSDLGRAHEVIDAAGVGDLDLLADEEWDPLEEDVATYPPDGDVTPTSTWDDEDDLAGPGPWHSRPWGRVVMALIALLVVVAMIATYALE